MMSNWFINLTIKNKLRILFWSLAFLIFSMAVFAVVRAVYIDRTYNMLLNSAVQRQIYIDNVYGNVMQLRFHYITRSYLLDTGSASVDVFINAVTASLSSFRQSVESDRTLTQEEQEAHLALLEEIKTLLDLYLSNVHFIEAAIVDNERQLLFRAIWHLSPIGDATVARIQRLRTLTLDTVRQKTEEAAYHSRLTSIINIGFSIIVFALALSLLHFVSKVITAPINNLKVAAREIAGGNTAYPIRSDNKDEFGELSNHIGDMVDKIIEMNATMTITDHLRNMVFVADMEYNVIYVNKSFTKSYKTTKEACINRKCYEIIRKRKSPCPACGMRRLIGKNKHEEYPTDEYKYEWDDSLNAWISGLISVIRWIDGSKVFFHSMYDETENKQTQEALQDALEAAQAASISKSSFLANMSHEIRTPMNSIIGFSELALDGAILDKNREYLSKILENAEGLLQIINDILDISKIEAGKIELENIPFSLSDIFTQCHNTVSPTAGEKGIVVNFYQTPLGDKKLLGDPTRLRQVFLNILSNAIKFTNSGIVSLSSSVISSEDDTVTMHFEIRDTGIGMTREQIDKIFEPFIQADNTTTRKYGGTGLGLTITKNIIELMKGELVVESIVGLGSKFSFDLTFDTIDVSGDTESESIYMNKQIEKPMFDGEILVFEDNRMNQRVICEHLARVGLTVEIAENGKVGLNILKRRIERGQKPFDIIFMDIHMPVMDGLEAASKIMELKINTPIVAMTANIMSNDVERYRACGMRDCVGKPFTSQQLWYCLLQYLKPLAQSVDLHQDENIQEFFDKTINTKINRGYSEDTKVAIGTMENRENADSLDSTSVKSEGAAVNSDPVNRDVNVDEDEVFMQELRMEFLDESRDSYNDISQAIKDGDIKLAHRLAHTLKSTSAQIGKLALQKAAANLEKCLKNDDTEGRDGLLGILQRELNKVLKDLESSD